METNWVKIYVSSEPYKVELLRNLLMESDIPSTVISRQDSMHLHLNYKATIEVFVAKDNAFRAVQIINKGDFE